MVPFVKLAPLVSGPGSLEQRACSARHAPVASSVSSVAKHRVVDVKHATSVSQGYTLQFALGHASCAPKAPMRKNKVHS